MKATIYLIVFALMGCAELNHALQYTNSKPQRFQTSIAALEISTLEVFRSEKQPGKLWVVPNPGKLIASSWGDRQSQFVALLNTTVEPAYRDAATRALKETPGGSCKIDSFTPWPNEFAIEYAYICNG